MVYWVTFPQWRKGKAPLTLMVRWLIGKMRIYDLVRKRLSDATGSTIVLDNCRACYSDEYEVSYTFRVTTCQVASIHPSIHPIAFSIRCLLPSTPVLKNQIESTIYCAKSEKVTTLNELSGIPPSKWCILMILEKLWKCKMLWLTSELLSIQWNRASLWLIFVKHSKKRWPKRYLESLGNSDSGSVSTEYLWWT